MTLPYTPDLDDYSEDLRFCRNLTRDVAAFWTSNDPRASELERVWPPAWEIVDRASRIEWVPDEPSPTMAINLATFHVAVRQLACGDAEVSAVVDAYDEGCVGAEAAARAGLTHAQHVGAMARLVRFICHAPDPTGPSRR